jgi:acyl carrier protein
MSLKRTFVLMERYRGKPNSRVCLICGAKRGANGLTPDALCLPCAPLLDWFRGYYADEPFELGTTDFLADSLDYVEWLIEAEEHFGIFIPYADAERMQTVGDFLAYIRHHAGKPLDKSRRASPLRPRASDSMWDSGLDG